MTLFCLNLLSSLFPSSFPSTISLSASLSLLILPIASTPPLSTFLKIFILILPSLSNLTRILSSALNRLTNPLTQSPPVYISYPTHHSYTIRPSFPDNAPINPIKAGLSVAFRNSTQLETKLRFPPPPNHHRTCDGAGKREGRDLNGEEVTASSVVGGRERERERARKVPLEQSWFGLTLSDSECSSVIFFCLLLER